MDIVEFGPDDATEVAAYAAVVNAANARTAPWRDPETPETVAGELRYSWDLEVGTPYLGRVGCEPAAVGLLHTTEWDNRHLAWFDLSVHPDHQRRGLGSAILDRLEAVGRRRGEAKADRPCASRVINTSSGAGLQGSIEQATYSSAKACIAGLTLVAAAELGRYGVTVNAIAPVAKTRMTEGAFDTSGMPEPEDNSPIVAWLASAEAADVTGRVIEVEGTTMTVEDGWRWRHGPSASADG